MRRSWVLGTASAVILAGAGTGVALERGHAHAAVRVAPAEAASANGVVQITFWNGHPSGALKKEMHTLVDEFNATHPHIHVTVIDKYAQIQPVTAAMTAGDAPNVIMPHLDAAQQFAADGYLVNLTPYIDGPSGFTKAQLSSFFYPSVWNGRAIEPGKQYILPFEENGHMVIFYNADLFKKAGISSPPKTWQQLGADARKITALGGSIHGIAWTPSMEQFLTMVADNGGKIWASSSETRFSLNNPQAVATLSFLHDLVAQGDMILTQNYDYQLDFGTGNIGLLIESSAGWTYDVQSVGGKFPVKASPAPAGTSGRAYNYVDGDSLAILNTGTKAQQDAAWTFIRWLASPAENAQWDQAANYLPIGPDAAAQLKPYYASHPDQAAAFTNPSTWLTDPAANATQYYAALTAMQTELLKALNGQESPQQAIANMNTVGNQYLSGERRS
ncbi:ABC transporter substrate-binding protein [Alicyclobacillus acidocaldarius]|uniref:ABC transporter substrate-binding protein n=1 Tax=Alicyclobacillus acidocaldarius TaxID=405212 RepID=UPI00345F0780